MPNFHTHWVVALEAVDSAPEYIQEGYVEYRSEVNKLAERLEDRINKINTKVQFSIFESTGFDLLIKGVDTKLEKSHKVHCFSAYTLGACGPDFWTLPSEANWSPVPDTAGIHFDMGHYNRTHRQFQVAIKRWAHRIREDSDEQKQLEKSYYMGMSSHIATDIIVHQLVNTYAGAYNRLEKKFENEHGMMPKNIWNTHNKLEHYWDTFLRYRYLSHYGQLWNGKAGQPEVDKQTKSWLTSKYRCRFPIVNKLIEMVDARDSECKVKSKLKSFLGKDKIRYEIEKYLIFPLIFCDKVVAKKDTNPFIYEICVNKKNGVYPKDMLFKQADDEATSYQMKDPDNNGKYNEKRKLNYFSDKINRRYAGKGYSCEYLTRIVCPNLENTRKYGKDGFYHTDALKSFLKSATMLSKQFSVALDAAITKAGASPGDVDKIDLGLLGKFWNLDLGMGIEVSHSNSNTVLNFVHINNVIVDAKITDFDKNDKPYKKRKTVDYTYPVKQINTPVPDKKDLTLEVQAAIAMFNEKEKPMFSIYADKAVKLDESVKHAEHKTHDWLKSDVDKAIDLSRPLSAPSSAQKNVEYKRNAATGLAEFKTKVVLKRDDSQKVVPLARRNSNKLSKPKPIKLNRNYAITLGRDKVLWPNNSGNFSDDKFSYYKNEAPSENAFFSLYPIQKNKDGEYVDLVSEEKVSASKLEEIKKIDCLGVNKIVILYDVNKKLTDCFIDGVVLKLG